MKKNFQKLFILLLALSTLNLSAKEAGFLNFGNKDFAKEKSDKSKWIIKSGVEHIAFQANLPEFEGIHQKFEKGDVEDIVGYGITFGREFYFGAGFSSSITLGLTYAKTLSRFSGKATPDIDEELAYTRKGHHVSSGEIQGSINYIFDYKIVDIQPFLEGSFGVGSASLDYRYHREPIGTADKSEDYNVRSHENYTFTKASLGVNLIAYNGLISYLKLTTAMVVVSDREINGTTNIAGSNTIVDVSSDEKNLGEKSSVTMASLGIGYMY
jgi:hypothetical protein